ncbi:MAG: metal ABC transporter substrate-binding protein [Desulfovibrionaceae bacterium]|nr:metal ABC transporter substrate-binding protein [Desulfovibrionaceae bacterium]MBF0512535.1 metal ABC transporter substrate-binding protein [Desulfovibrionaceae bacterium]
MIRRILGAVLLACLMPAVALAGQPLPVAASFSILGDMVKNVGGDRVAVTTLVGPNQDTHAYEPRPSDAKALAGAGLVFVNGLGFEGWMPRLIEASGAKGKTIVASHGVKTITMINEDEGGKKITDPHAWQDLSNGKLYVANIEKALSQADPEGAETYRANARSYIEKITELDAWVKTGFAKVPTAERKIITSHDAFGYFGAAYGVTILAPMGFSTESEASAKNVGGLIRQIRQEKVKALFIENMSDPRLIERIAKETGTKVGGALYSDALSAPDQPGATYLDMFRNNAGKMVAAMTGQ